MTTEFIELAGQHQHAPLRSQQDRRGPERREKAGKWQPGFDLWG